jgi:SHS2 domain-containing protein
MESGFKELDHTADWELHIWAPDLCTLLQTSAQGMYALAETKLTKGPAEVRRFEIRFEDPETLLVDFLTELIYFGEGQGIAFNHFILKLNHKSLKVHANGAAIESQTKEIKAVTYHGMQILETSRGLEVHIIFDV